jgi:hypothetical protein
MVLKHPVTNQPIRDAKGEEAYIDLLSLDSQKALAFDRVAGDRRLERLARARSVPTSVEFEAEQTDRMATLTTGWRLLNIDGTAMDVPFTEANARELYAFPWIRQQVALFQGNLANFVKASSTT